MSKFRAIIGLGTGRCGTRSLAYLLSMQPGVERAHHERSPVLSWKNDPNPLRHIEQADQDQYGVGVFVDVGFYYLPHVPAIQKKYPDTKFVCLKRSREQTVASFVRVRPNRADWFKSSNRHAWTRSFPVYDHLTYEQAAGQYWEDYYRRASELESDTFRVFPTEALNDQRSVVDLLCFCGFGCGSHVEAGVRIRDHMDNHKYNLVVA